VAVAVAVAVRDRAATDAIARSAIRHEGTVVEREGDGSAEVRYTNQLTGQELAVTLYASSDDLIPDNGAPVALDVARADPEHLRVAGDVIDPSYIWWFAALPLIPAAVIGGRRLAARRVARSVRSSDGAYAMVGMLAPPWRLGRRATLLLYPLDARSGARPACAVPLLDTRAVPVGPLFGVVVKGIPRPLGHIVASAGEEVLWPSGRALPSATTPMPDDPLVPIERPESVDAPIIVKTAGMVTVVFPELMLAAVASILFAVIAAVTISNARAAHRLESTGAEVIATVTSRGSSALTIEYVATGDPAPRTALAPVDFPDDYTVGRRYPAVVDADDPGNARLPKEPYDPVAPILWVAAPVALTWLSAFRRMSTWRANRQAAEAADTVWYRPMATMAGRRFDRARIVLGTPSGRPTCVALLPDSVATRVSESPDGELLVAGFPGPGQAIALCLGGELIPLGFTGAVVRLGDLDHNDGSTG
jgi:hypothetical protein